jgi:hypothetical protein
MLQPGNPTLSSDHRLSTGIDPKSRFANPNRRPGIDGRISSADPRRGFKHRITGEDVRAVKVEGYDPLTCPCCKGQYKGCQRCKLTQKKMANGQLPPPLPAGTTRQDSNTKPPGSPDQSSSASEASVLTPPRAAPPELPWCRDEEDRLVRECIRFSNEKLGKSAVSGGQYGAFKLVNQDDLDWYDVRVATNDDLAPVRQPRHDRQNGPLMRHGRSPK